MVTDEPLLRVTARRSASEAVLTLAGEADISTEGRLRLRIGDLLADPSVDRVVVDASGLAFLDLSCLQALLDAHAALERRGGCLVLRAPTRRVRRLLEVLRVDLPVETR